jgi:AraC-like DNA-binding protein
MLTCQPRQSAARPRPACRRPPRSASLKISAIALDAGFGNLSYFNASFRRRYGASPSDLRKGRREH